MISKFDLQKLQDLPIEQVAGALGLQVSHHKSLCPFHNDSHPSLTYHRGKNRYKCYVCDAHGGVIDLVMNYLHKDFVSACKWLSDNQGLGTMVESLGNFPHPSSLIPPPSKPFDTSRYARFFERPWLSPEARKFLYDERHLDARVIRWCRLTSWKDKQGVPWLQIPYYSRDGKLIGIQNRNLSWSKIPPLGSAAWPVQEPSSLTPQPRFRFPAGPQCSIYNLPVLNLLKPGETLFIAEGASDCWSLLSSGHKAIAIPSATLLTRKDKELLQSLNSQPLSLRSTSGRSFEPASLENLHFAMYPDNDLPGEKLFLQLQKVLPTLVRHQLPKGCKDFSELYLQRLNPSTLRSSSARSQREISHPSTGFSEPSMLNVKC